MSEPNDLELHERAAARAAEDASEAWLASLRDPAKSDAERDALLYKAYGLMLESGHTLDNDEAAWLDKYEGILP